MITNEEVVKLIQKIKNSKSRIKFNKIFERYSNSIVKSSNYIVIGTSNHVPLSQSKNK